MGLPLLAGLHFSSVFKKIPAFLKYSVQRLLKEGLNLKSGSSHSIRDTIDRARLNTSGRVFSSVFFAKSGS